MRCSLPEALSAPSTVPTMEQQTPTKAIITMNQRMDTVWVTSTPQQVLEAAEGSCSAWPWPWRWAASSSAINGGCRTAVLQKKYNKDDD